MNVRRIMPWLLAAAIVAVGGFIGASWTTSDTSRERLECDRQMTILFSLHDPFEFQRAMFLINAMNLSHRLSPAAYQIRRSKWLST